MNLTKKFLVIVCILLFSLPSEAYFGSYDPIPFRNKATITFIDTPIPNIECAKMFNPVVAPLAISSVLGCVDVSLTKVIVSATPSPFWTIIVANGLTPKAVLGHEVRHIFDGFWHGALPFSDRLQYSTEDRRTLLDRQNATEVRVERRNGENTIRLLSKEEERETDCLIFIREEGVSYDDLGELMQECLKE